MAETKHTPAPWRVRFSRDGEWMEGIQGSPDEGERYGGMVVNRGIAKPKSARGLANARLIAAAPSLLKALTALVPADFDEHPDDFMPEWHAARSALALAVGEG